MTAWRRSFAWQPIKFDTCQFPNLFHNNLNWILNMTINDLNLFLNYWIIIMKNENKKKKSISNEMKRKSSHKQKSKMLVFNINKNNNIENQKNLTMVCVQWYRLNRNLAAPMHHNDNLSCYHTTLRLVLVHLPRNKPTLQLDCLWIFFFFQKPINYLRNEFNWNKRFFLFLRMCYFLIYIKLITIT